MKSYLLTFIHACLVLIVVSCAPVQMVSLDPITVTENVRGSNVYHGSYTRTIDIVNTRLDLKFNWDSAAVIGTATILAKPYFYPADHVILDANGFRINSVQMLSNDDRKILKYSYDGKKLHVSLDKSYTREQTFSLLIDYIAMPNKLVIGKDIASAGDRGLYFINRTGKDKDTPVQIWTQGETECNSSWFPTINDPQEKMSQDINLTVPEKYVTLSNGLLEYSALNGDGTRTDSWRQEQPHSTYLTMIAVGEFVITKDTWNEKEVSYYTEAKYAPMARTVFGKTPEMMDFFSKKLGVEYPWEKYSQIVVRDFVSGAMENTTASVFFDKLNMSAGEYLDENHEDIIAHELFHHWFGNLVTAESWSNLPMNESFATYGEYLWEEHKYGRDAADAKGFEDLSVYLTGSKNKQADVIRFDYADREQMFDEVSYQKGSRILHMLRKTVGDEAFFKALNLYLTRLAYKTAEIHDFRLILEEVTGTDLNWFFSQWFLAGGHPVLNVESTYNSVKGEVQLRVEQIQTNTGVPVYILPVSVDIYTDGNKIRREILINKQSQTFSIPVTAQPDLVNFDAEKYLLGEINQKKNLAQYAAQYELAPLFLDRLDALSAMVNSKDQTEAHRVSMLALKDRNWQIRRLALSIVPSYGSELQSTAYPRVSEMAMNDTSSHVRAAAIDLLKTVYRSRDNSIAFEKARKDLSPAVSRAVKGAGQSR